MPRGERRGKAPAAGTRRTETVFNNPLAGALAARQKAEAEAARAEAEAKAKARREAPRHGASNRPEPAPALDDDAVFRAAMSGVSALPETSRVEPPRSPPPTSAPQSADEDAESMARLADLCAGSGPFALEDTAEYMEGSASGVDRRLVRRLRRGEYSVQAHLDLHGQTRDEARAAVERFIVSSRARGLRCVLVVHGRGLNSKDNIPVLKQSVGAWLQRGRIGKCVLAFATARPHDGGAGAVYVLLRK